MKKITRTLTVILSLILILSACTPAGTETTQNATDATTTEEITTEENTTEGSAVSTGQTEASTESTEQTEAEPLSPEEQILAERRDAVVEYMRSLVSVLWRATADIEYENHEGDSFVLKAGRIYRGMPYTNAAGTLASFLEYAQSPSEKGVYVISGITAESLNGAASAARLGNDCSSAVYTSLSQIGASVTCTTTRYMCEKNGYIKVGEWESDFSDIRNTPFNSSVVMSEAYAKLQKGDILVRDGHVMMVVDVTIQYNLIGEIDISKSYVTVLEQTRSRVKSSATYDDPALGEKVYQIGAVDAKYTFKGLSNQSYFPYTCKELIDPSTVPDPYVTDSETTYTADNLLVGTLSTNWSIDAVTISITDKDSKVVQEATARVRRGRNREFDLQQFVTDVPGGILGKVEPEKLETGQYKCKVVCRLTTGQEFVVREFEFTK